LYGFESWIITKEDLSKVDVFHNCCLYCIGICNIHWPNKIPIRNAIERQGVGIRLLRLRIAFYDGSLERSMTTSRRTLMKEEKEMGLPWGDMQAKAQSGSGV